MWRLDSIITATWGTYHMNDDMHTDVQPDKPRMRPFTDLRELWLIIFKYGSSSYLIYVVMKKHRWHADIQAATLMRGIVLHVTRERVRLNPKKGLRNARSKRMSMGIPRRPSTFTRILRKTSGENQFASLRWGILSKLYFLETITMGVLASTAH